MSGADRDRDPVVASSLPTVSPVPIPAVSTLFSLQPAVAPFPALSVSHLIILDQLQHQLHLSGFDICQLFSIAAYNSIMPLQNHIIVNETKFGSTPIPIPIKLTEELNSQPQTTQSNTSTSSIVAPSPPSTTSNSTVAATFASASASVPTSTSTSTSTSFGVLIGNSRYFWSFFIRHMQQRISQSVTGTVEPNPLDLFCNESINRVCRSVLPSNWWIDIRFSPDVTPNRVVSMQKLASVSGLSHLDESSHLAIHPTFGSWHAFRAAIVISIPSEPLRSEGNTEIDLGIDKNEAIVNSSIWKSYQALRVAATKYENQSSILPNHSTLGSNCSTPASSSSLDSLSPCVRFGCFELQCLRFSQAIHADTSNTDSASWIRWLAIRDACNIGREHRYSQQQIEYHYNGNRPENAGWRDWLDEAKKQDALTT